MSDLSLQQLKRPVEKEAIRSLLRQYPYKPFGWISRFNTKIPLKKLDQLSTEHLLNRIKENSIVETLENGNQVIGIGIAQRDDWDSEQLSFEVFKIVCLLYANGIKHNLPRTSLGCMVFQEQAKTTLVKKILYRVFKERSKGQTSFGTYVFARTPELDSAGIKALQANGFESIDSIITFAGAIPYLRKVVGGRGIKASVLISRACESDLSPLFTIAEDSFRFDRFHSDSTIPKSLADKVYRAWICASFVRREILVARLKDTVVGFLSYANHFLAEYGIATIELIATHPNFRNLGIGRALIAEAIESFAAAGIAFICVGTQSNNQSAIQFYRSCGFEIVESFRSFRKWLSKP